MYTKRPLVARRKSRALTRVIVLLVLAMTLVLFLPRVYRVWAGDDSTPAFIEVTVQKGDTLWSIAGRYLGDGMDRRKAVYEIEVLNELESDNIYPGQVIRIPVLPN